jgi:hypothetical protein
MTLLENLQQCTLNTNRPLTWSGWELVAVPIGDAPQNVIDYMLDEGLLSDGASGPMAWQTTSRYALDEYTLLVIPAGDALGILAIAMTPAGVLGKGKSPNALTQNLQVAIDHALEGINKALPLPVEMLKLRDEMKEMRDTLDHVMEKMMGMMTEGPFSELMRDFNKPKLDRDTMVWQIFQEFRQRDLPVEVAYRQAAKEVDAFLAIRQADEEGRGAA